MDTKVMKNNQDVWRLKIMPCEKQWKELGRLASRRWESKGDMIAVLNYLKKFCVKTANEEI